MSEQPETIKLLASLVQREMNAEDGVWIIYNQKRRLPAEKGYYGVVSLLGIRPFGVNARTANDPQSPDLVETVSSNQQETIQIEIFSYDDSARLRNVEIIYALASTAAQQLQEKYSFKIGRVPPSFVDVSEVQASKRLNRYALAFNVLRAYSRNRLVQTFSTFQNPPKTILTNP